MTKTKNNAEDSDLVDENSEEEDDSELDEEKFKCKVCGEVFDGTEGDDLILLCDGCAENYNVDKIWSEYDKDIITDDDLKNLDLKKYLLK
jgi:rubredoxin